MKDLEKYIKALLLKLNRKGYDINYEMVQRYNKDVDSILTTCYLVFWYKQEEVDKKTGEVKIKRWRDKVEFRGVRKYADMIFYLQKVGVNNGEEREEEKTITK